MIFQCDFHIHSVLSPCADALMTPANIVNMARLQGLDVIAVTDHQSCGNCAATMDTAKKLGGPLVIPGLEAESAEEIHLICLFPDLDAVQKMTDLIRLHLPPIANRPDIFGDQIYYDADDQPRGTEEILLMQACGLSVDEIADHAVALGWLFWAAFRHDLWEPQWKYPRESIPRIFWPLIQSWPDAG